MKTMPHFALIYIMALGMSVATALPVAAAENGFGSSFANQTPGAFDDPDPQSLAARLAPIDDDMGMDAAAMADIMPAAGDEAEGETPSAPQPEISEPVDSQP